MTRHLTGLDGEISAIQPQYAYSRIILGAFVLKRPIIPWPGYEDGESSELAGVIQAAVANAKH